MRLYDHILKIALQDFKMLIKPQEPRGATQNWCPQHASDYNCSLGMMGTGIVLEDTQLQKAGLGVEKMVENILPVE